MPGNRIGTYSITTSFNLPWNNKRTLPASSDKKKNKKLKPVINPIFQQCASLTDDKFWQSIFMDCARDKFPRNFSYKNGLVTHRKGNKILRLEISNSPSEVFTSTKEFFSVTGGILSAQDRKKMQLKEEEKLAEKLRKKEVLTWKSIKSEKMKDVLITEFVADVSEKMNFNEDEKKELITTVKKGFMLKYFKPQNIILEEGKISEIEGLYYDKKTGAYEIDESYIPRKTVKKTDRLGIEKSESKMEVNFLDIWSKYLEDLENKKMKVKNNHTYSSSALRNEDSEDVSMSYTS